MRQKQRDALKKGSEYYFTKALPYEVGLFYTCLRKFNLFRKFNFTLYKRVVQALLCKWERDHF